VPIIPLLQDRAFGPQEIKVMSTAFQGALNALGLMDRADPLGRFPDGQSCLNLAAARLRYIAGTAWSAKCYMNMRPLYRPQVTQTEAVA